MRVQYNQELEKENEELKKENKKLKKTNDDLVSRTSKEIKTQKNTNRQTLKEWGECINKRDWLEKQDKVKTEVINKLSTKLEFTYRKFLDVQKENVNLLKEKNLVIEVLHVFLQEQ